MSPSIASPRRPADLPAVWRVLLLAVSAAVLLALPWWGGTWTGRAIEIAYMLSLAMLWNLLAGFAGVVSIGQQAFVGLGGYTLFALVILAGVPPLLALPVAGLVTAVVALPTALLLFRLRGPYFAIGSWVVADVFRLLMAQVSALGGGSGQSLPVAAVRGIATSRSARETVFWFVALGLAVGCLALVWGLLRARQGLGLTAMRDSEAAAASLGVNLRTLKLTVFVAVAFATGLLGALIFLHTLRISPDAAFSVADWTADVIFIVVIGGIGTLEGPFAGTAVYFLLRSFFAGFGGWYLIALGILAVLVMLLAPEGLCGALSIRFGLTLFPTQRRLAAAATPRHRPRPT